MKAVLFRLRIDCSELLRRAARLVTADSDPDDARVLFPQSDRLVHYTLRRIRAEVSHRIGDPQYRDAEIFFASFAPCFDALEQRLEFLSAPLDDARARVDFRVLHAFRAQ